MSLLSLPCTCRARGYGLSGSDEENCVSKKSTKRGILTVCRDCYGRVKRILNGRVIFADKNYGVKCKGDAYGHVEQQTFPIPAIALRPACGEVLQVLPFVPSEYTGVQELAHSVACSIDQMCGGTFAQRLEGFHGTLTAANVQVMAPLTSKDAKKQLMAWATKVGDGVAARGKKLVSAWVAKTGKNPGTMHMDDPAAFSAVAEHYRTAAGIWAMLRAPMPWYPPEMNGGVTPTIDDTIVRVYWHLTRNLPNVSTLQGAYKIQREMALDTINGIRTKYPDGAVGDWKAAQDMYLRLRTLEAVHEGMAGMSACIRMRNLKNVEKW